MIGEERYAATAMAVLTAVRSFDLDGRSASVEDVRALAGDVSPEDFAGVLWALGSVALCGLESFAAARDVPLDELLRAFALRVSAAD